MTIKLEDIPEIKAGYLCLKRMNWEPCVEGWDNKVKSHEEQEPAKYSSNGFMANLSKALKNKTLISSTALLSFLGVWLVNPHTKTEQAIKNPTPVVEPYNKKATQRPANMNLSFSKAAYANNTTAGYTKIIRIIQPILDSRAPSGKRPVLEKEIKASKEILQQGLDLEQIVKEMQQPLEKTLKHADIVYLTRDANGNELDIYNHSDLKQINENYKKQVWNSDKPVLVMFCAGDFGKPKDVMDPGNGLASVYKHIQEKFGDEIKFCAYKVSDNYYVPRGIKPFIRETYGAKTVPAILFYDNDGGEIEKAGSLSKGICSLDGWLRGYNKNDHLIKKYILD